MEKVSEVAVERVVPAAFLKVRRSWVEGELRSGTSRRYSPMSA